ncbi:type VI secretion system tip protein VgrG, partial [Jiella sp. MQZ9-1]|nr:type VI secretion system tip protein VgrG [Jiella flava]
VTSKFQALTDKISGLANKLGVPDALNMGEGNMIIGVGKNKAETVMVSSSEIVGGAKTVMVGGGYQLTVGGIENKSVLMGAYEEIGQNKTIVVGKQFEIVCGKTRITLKEEGVIEIEAEKGIVLKSNRIDMN